jgi:hypothetical protein
LGLRVLIGESAVDVWDVLIIKFLTVQIKETASQFSTPLYLPPEQKKRGVSGHNKKPIIIRYFLIFILNYSMIAEFAGTKH